MMTQNYFDKVRRLRLPLRCTIELLAPCNLKCPHCYVTHSKKNALTFPVMQDLLRQLADAGMYYVTFTGGEIGLRKDLFDIIKEARSHHMAVKLLSSGTRWGPREWDRIAELGVGYVRMSLYALNPKVHDEVTLTDGSHALTMATAEGLMERGVEVAFACPIMKTNAHDVPNLIDYCDSRDIELLIDANITMTDTGGHQPKATAADFAALVAVFSDPRVRKRLGGDDPCSTERAEGRTCGVGQLSVFIQCTGDVLPCSRWPNSAGNLLHHSFLDIWRNSPELSFARAITRADQTSCASCGDKGSCSPCVAMNLRENESIARPSLTVCTDAAAKATAKFGKTQQPQFRVRLPIVA